MNRHHLLASLSMTCFDTIRSKQFRKRSLVLSLIFLAGAAQFLLCWGNPISVSASSGNSATTAKASAVVSEKPAGMIAPHTFQQQVTLAPSDLASGDKFGFATGLSEDFNTALVAAEGQNSLTGAAYIYLRDANGNWSQQQKLTAQDAAPNDSFGCWMALSGDGTTAIIGAYTKNQSIGAAYIFARDVNGNWSQQQKLTASDGVAGDSFGGWVAIARDGNTVLVSASHKNNLAGAAYVFTRTNSVWNQQQKLVSQDIAAMDDFGSWLGLSGDGTTALIGAFTKNTNVGAAYVFALNGSTWTQQQKLTPSDPLQGSDFSFAATLSRDGNTAILGAATQNQQTGAAYIFVRDGSGNWTQQQKLVPADVGHNDYFGFAVSLSGTGDVALISAKGKNSNSGAAYIFSRYNGNWTQQQELTEQNAQPNDDFGVSLALNRDGTIALIGADHSNSAKGAAYIFGQAPVITSLSLIAPVTTQVSTPFTVTVQALDQYGNIFPSFPDRIHFYSTDNTAILPANYTFTAADNGVHTFTSAVTLNTLGNQTLSVKDDARTNIISSTGIAVVNGPPSSTSYVYNLPFLGFKAGGFTSYLAFQNTSASSANVLVQYYKADGSPLSSAPLASNCTTLVGHGECLPPNPFDLGDSGSGVIVSSQPLAVIVAEGTPYGGSAYGVSQGSSDTLIAPIILHNAYSDFSTQLTLFNGGASSALVTAQFYDQNGSLQNAATQTVNLAPHSSRVFDQSASSSNLPNSFKGWARITSASGSQLVSQVLEQSPGQHFVAIANAQPKALPTLYAPAIFRGAFNFTTGFNLVNPGSTAINATVTYYDDNGTAYAAAPFNIGPNSVVAVFQGDSSGTGLPGNGGLPGNFSGAAIVTSTGGDGLVMVINEGGGVTSAGTSLSGVYAAAGKGSNSVSLPVMANGGYGYRTGATIFNTSDQAVSGTIQYYDTSGNPVLSPRPFNIGPHASKLAYQGDPNQLPDGFYGTAVVTQTSGGGSSGLIVTTNALSGLFYTYTQPS